MEIVGSLPTFWARKENGSMSVFLLVSGVWCRAFSAGNRTVTGRYRFTVCIARQKDQSEVRKLYLSVKRESRTVTKSTAHCSKVGD
jgi:hypothetical protein